MPRLSRPRSSNSVASRTTEISASQGVSLEDLADRVDGDGLEGPAGAGRRGRLEQGVVDGPCPGQRARCDAPHTDR